MEQTLELLQKQKQILTQKQIQSLTILAMDNVELDCFLRQEYLDNPMLEINGQSPETVYESLPVLPSVPSCTTVYTVSEFLPQDARQPFSAAH